MLLQWTLLQLASLGIDDGSKNITGSIPNLTPLIGTNPLFKPPPVFSQLLLPNTPAETSPPPPPPPPQIRCQNHSSQLIPAPSSPHTEASVSDTGDISKSEAKISKVTTHAAATTATNEGGLKLVPQGGNGDAPEVTMTPSLDTATSADNGDFSATNNDGSKLVTLGGNGDAPEARMTPALEATPSAEATTPTSAENTTVTSGNATATVDGTDDGNTPEEATAVTATTIPESVSETSPKEDSEDIMNITTQINDSGKDYTYMSSEDIALLNEVLDSLDQLNNTGTSQQPSSIFITSTPSGETALTNDSSDASIGTQTDISVITRVDLGETTPSPTVATPLPDESLDWTQLQTSQSEVPVVTQEGERNEVAGKSDTGVSPHVAEIGPGSIATPSHLPSAGTISDSSGESTLGVNKISDTVLPATANEPGMASGAAGTSSSVMTGGNAATQQGTLELRPDNKWNSDDISATGNDHGLITGIVAKPATANEHGLPPGVVAVPSYVLNGGSEAGKDTLMSVPVNEDGSTSGVLLTMGNEVGLLQPAARALNSPKDTVISEPGNVPANTPAILTPASHVLTGGNAAGHTQPWTLALTPGSGISSPANGQGLTHGVVGIPSQVFTTGSAAGHSQQGSLGLNHGTGAILTGSENFPGYPTGFVGIPSQLSAANMAALLPQAVFGLQPGSAHLGNTMHSQIQPAIPLEQLLAPLISALLVKEWQEHPQYMFGRSQNRFQAEEPAKSFTEEEEQLLSNHDTRQRRSAGEIFRRYQIVKSAIDKFLNMRPKTQDFLVRQGVKLTARKVGEMLKSYGPQIKEWINGKLPSLNIDSSSYTVGDEVANLVRQFADSMEHYIETLPH